MKWKTANQAGQRSMGYQIPGDPVFKTCSQISCCSHAYWMLAYRKGTVFQYKCFTLSKIQIRGGSLNTSKNVKHFNRKFFSEGLQQLKSQTWPASVRIRGLPGDRFFSICTLGSLYTFLWCPHWRQGRMWPCVYLMTLSMSSSQQPGAWSAVVLKKLLFQDYTLWSAGSLNWADNILSLTRKARCSVLVPQLI